MKAGRTLIISDGACPDHGMDKSRGQEREATDLLLRNCSKNRSWASPGAATKRDARHSADRQRLPRRVKSVTSYHHQATAGTPHCHTLSGHLQVVDDRLRPDSTLVWEKFTVQELMITAACVQRAAGLRSGPRSPVFYIWPY